jgi:hypothetical protein
MQLSIFLIKTIIYLTPASLLAKERGKRKNVLSLYFLCLNIPRGEDGIVLL